mmetsp:Transcript_81049/g.99314  ORF Transcript_81049/g.99314 Transcript_81049/m.99314 type:complete len:326 (+) Transcript_81049:106-1083(+)
MKTNGAQHPSDFWEVPENYDWGHETSDNYQVKGKAMAGPYKAIREKLDFEYHGCYGLKRQQLQDAIIQRILGTSGAGTGEGTDPHPWIVFTAGSFFAGKSWVVSWMLEQGHLPLDLVRTDPDLIRTQLPEWSGYLKRDGPEAAVMTQREAGTCALIAQWEAMRQSCNILVDGSLRNSARQKEFFAEIRAAYPQYRIAIIHVFSSWDIMQQRSSVAREGGRVTSPKALRASFDAVTNAVAELEPVADLTLHINNDGLEPRLISVSQAGERINLKWKGIREMFQQVPGPNFSFLKTFVIFVMVTGLACFLPLLGAGSEMHRKSCFPF